MNRIVAPVFTLFLALQPLQAQETAPPEDEGVQEGFSLLEEGARIIMRSMLEDMRPTLEDLESGIGSALADLQPALRDLVGMIDDFRNYDPPVMLPNGDIIIRRRNIPLPPRSEPEIEL